MQTIAPLSSNTRAASPTKNGSATEATLSEDTSLSTRDFTRSMFNSAAAVFVAANMPTLLAQTITAPKLAPDTPLKRAELELIQAIKDASPEEKKRADFQFKVLEQQKKNRESKLDSLGLLGKGLSDQEIGALYHHSYFIDKSKGIAKAVTPGSGGIVKSKTGQLIRFERGNNLSSDVIFGFRQTRMANSLIDCQTNIKELTEIANKGSAGNYQVRALLVYKAIESIGQKFMGIDRPENVEEATKEYKLLSNYLRELGFNITITRKPNPISEYTPDVIVNVAVGENTQRLIRTSPDHRKFLEYSIREFEEAIDFGQINEKAKTERLYREIFREPMPKR